jgi:predicted choloylglycine hydrolase
MINERIFRGDYYQNGVELGKFLRTIKFSIPNLPEERLKLAEGCEKAVKTFTPDLLVELNGILDGGKFHETHLKEWSLSLIEFPILGCSVFAISKNHTENGKTIFGRNYDWDKWVADYSVLWKGYPEKKLASISGTDLFVGRYCGLNEAGLAIAVTAMRGFKGDSPGVALHYVVRWILDNCHNVDEASRFMEKIPHFRGNGYLLADSNDKIVYVEATPNKTIIQDETKKGIAIITNHYRSQETMIYENEDNISITSKPRFNVIHGWFESKKGKISEKEIEDILCNKLTTNTGVCEDRFSNFFGETIPYGTIWTWIASCQDRYIRLTHETYNGRNFRKYIF